MMLRNLGNNLMCHPVVSCHHRATYSHCHYRNYTLHKVYFIITHLLDPQSWQTIFHVFPTYILVCTFIDRYYMKTIYQTLSSSLSLLFFIGQKIILVFSRAWEKRIVNGDGVCRISWD